MEALPPPRPTPPPLSRSLSSPSPSNYQVWLGRHNLFEDEDTAQFAGVSEDFPNPGFNLSLLENHTRHPGEDYSHDLMLLRLQEPVQLTQNVQVLGLPTKEPQLGTTCYASGWGSVKPDECMLAPRSPGTGHRGGREEGAGDLNSRV